ncbi:hypothetical protein [Winogradskyella bathintestinalis]|uniref:Uncharacterized protein n=1 Tax=Winogradskyella bathintestinalis TaxID=3035208 RepID=A0ABT7ZUN0_9FLAO|nr:hypothetical protein [Winogradskyella bathintestinalis]MDN3492732.1 hypothetical protein [Winogradskyella bathintestinalis]
MKKKYLFILLILFSIVSVGFTYNHYKQNHALLKVESNEGIEDINVKNRNKAVLVKTLLHNNWLSVPEIYRSSYKSLRHILISKIADRTKISENELIKVSDEELSSTALAYRFILESDLRTRQEIQLFLHTDLKQTVVTLNAEKTDYSLSTLKSFSTYKNLQLANQWWLPKKNMALISKMNSVDTDNGYFQVKDDLRRTTEVLRIVKADEADYKYLGVYHSMVSKNHFMLYLAGSNDLKSWTRITNLGNRSHQGDIKKWGNGYLLVNEEDKEEGSNNIQVRFYESYQKLILNQSEKDISLSKSFSRFAEGTPDIREIIGGTPEESHLLIGFHYYNKGDVDYQAIGILKDFKDWKAWKDELTNKNIIAMGFKGNIGGRYSFNNLGQSFLLQEAQIKKNDFSTWKLLIGDGAFYTELDLKTPNKSTSFANPSITSIEDGKLVISTFLPSEGNSHRENGQLIYTVNP